MRVGDDAVPHFLLLTLTLCIVLVSAETELLSDDS